MNDDVSNHIPENAVRTNTTETAAARQAPPALVVYGLDDGGKPHASLFDATDADLAEKAAELMNMRAIRLDAPEHLAAASGLPRGRIFGSGKAFVPFVKKALYERLTALGGEPAPRNGSQTISTIRNMSTRANGARGRSEPAHETTDDSVPKITAQVPPASKSSSEHEDLLLVGEVVLAPELEASWWEAVIVAIEDDLVTLKWRDFPGEPSFQRQRNQIAFVPAGYVLPS